MATQIATADREVLQIEDARVRPTAGVDVLEPLPSGRIPYRLVDPFNLVHEALGKLRERFDDRL
jgi:hypothetical protein